MMNTFTANKQGDKHKHPETKNVRYMTIDDAKQLKYGDHVLVLDQSGCYAICKVTSVKTWKRKPEVVVHLKYGLYEHFTETFINSDSTTNLVMEV